jgi:maleamate amidohydrolase
MTLYVSRWSGGDIALILIDVIKGFYEPGGEFYHAVYAESLPAIARLLEAGRLNGRLIIHARETHLPGEPNFELIKLPDHAESGSFHQAFVSGFEPAGNEIELNKRRYSAFFATDLALRLAEYGIKRVVLAGCKTNVCIRATAQDAFGYGLDVVIPKEAVASNRPHLHTASLEDMDRYMGRVVGLEQAIELLQGKPLEKPASLETDQGVRLP